MRKRRIQQISLLLVLIVLCLGGLFALRVTNANHTTEVQVYNVMDTQMSDLSAVGLNNANGAIAMVLTPTGIEVMDAEESFSQEELMAFVYQMTHLTSTVEITDFGDGSDYGLEAPQAIFAMIAQDGSQQTLQLLQESAIGGQYYLYSTQKNAIYMITADQAKAMLRSRLDFTDKTVFPRVTVETLGAVQQFTLTNKDSADGSFAVENKGDFVLTAPIQSTINSVVWFTDVLTPLGALYPQAVVADAVDFSDPDVHISLQLDGTTYTLDLLANENGYLASNGTGVYQLAQEDVAFLGTTYMDLLKNKVYDFNLGNLSTITLAGAINATMDINGTSTDMVGKLGGQTLDYLQVGELFKPLNAVQILARCTDADMTDVQLTVTFTTQLGVENVVEFGKTDANGAIPVAVNGVVNFSTTDKFVNDILSTWKQ